MNRGYKYKWGGNTMGNCSVPAAESMVAGTHRIVGASNAATRAENISNCACQSVRCVWVK